MRVTRRSAFVSLTAAALLVLAGCSGDAPASTDRVESTPDEQVESSAPATDEASQETGEVALGSVGFVADDILPTVYATLVNSTLDVVMVEVNYAAYDAAGAVLGTTVSYDVIASETTSQTATYISVPDGSAIAKVDAQVTVSDSQPDAHPDIAMTAGNITILADEWSTKVTGTIDSTYTQSVTNVAAAAICTDAAGTVVAAGSTYLSGTVVPGTPAPFDISLTAASVPTACTVTAGVSNISEGS
ncbi:hypothetical protein [Cellulomonas sp. Root137]|uniref:hypothetical protein n=1 Tax=Cellulomonas sp. Root137 TaxID=1736459 RepID=UPI0006FF1C34|nr:hypothetical protein [Cellulomonas sp. Root137]KQY46208.1 hypothetical protein ASD18_01660 [Cellulomonas sp. Root137]